MPPYWQQLCLEASCFQDVCLCLCSFTFAHGSHVNADFSGEVVMIFCIARMRYFVGSLQQCPYTLISYNIMTTA